MDRRLGTTEKGFRCLTCSATTTTCPGHFGHIELCRPNFHIGFLDITLKILRCVCYHCSALLCNTTDAKFQSVLKIERPTDRLSAILDLCTSSGAVVCSGNSSMDVVEKPDAEVLDGPPIAKRK